MEERRSWLPPGLESSRTDPDDRASQRGRSEKQQRAKPERRWTKQPEAKDSKPGSDVDALGQDKHRKVIGQHNPHRGRQFLYYGIFIAFLAAAYIGLKAGAGALDKAPAHDPDQAPWSQPGAPQGPLGGFEPRKPGEKGHPTHFQ